MKNIYTLGKAFFVSILICLLTVSEQSVAQSVMPLPAHGSIWSGSSRGLWFTAPCDFIITGIRAPLDVGTNAQSIHLVKLTAPPPAFSSTTTAFTTLFYGANIAGTGFVPMSIQVTNGDVIGVIAIRVNATGTSQTSYGTPTGQFTSSIGTHSVVITRLGWQGQINNSPAVDFWTEVNGSIGRAEIQYVLALPTDAGLSSFVNMGDSLCSGSNPVSVSLKNYGPNTLMDAEIKWEVNNVAQPTFNWTGSVPVNDSVDVNIGSYTFQTGITYDITAWLGDVNNDVDTFPANDTTHISGIIIKPSPELVLNDTAFVICQGDSAQITGTLTGTPPWNITLHDGTTSYPFTNVTTPSFGLWIAPTSSKTFTVTHLTDATACANNDSMQFYVSVVPQPPAAITPVGSTAACFGDSVTLMGSIGLNFNYEWSRNDTIIPNSNNYVLSVKQGGDYKVKVISPNGCTNISAPVTVVIHPLPEVFLGKDTALLPVQSILLNAGAGFNSYLWSTGATTQSILIDSAGVGIGVKTVWVHVTDNYYCLGGDTILINFTNHPGINEAFSNADIRIIPNPSDGRIELQFSGIPAGVYDIEIFSPDGKAVYRSKHQLNYNNINLDLSHLANGVYLLKVTGNPGKVSRRLIIED